MRAKSHPPTGVRRGLIDGNPLTAWNMGANSERVVEPIVTAL